MGIVALPSLLLLERSPDNVTFTAIPGVVSWSAGDIAAEELDASDYDSPNDQREYLNGMKDASDGSFVVNWDPDNSMHQTLDSDVGGAAIYLRHQFTATRRAVFPMLVKGVSQPVEVGGLLRATYTVKPSAAATWETF